MDASKEDQQKGNPNFEFDLAEFLDVQDWLSKDLQLNLGLELAAENNLGYSADISSSIDLQGGNP